VYPLGPVIFLCTCTNKYQPPDQNFRNGPSIFILRGLVHHGGPYEVKGLVTSRFEFRRLLAFWSAIKKPSDHLIQIRIYLYNEWQSYFLCE